MSGRIGGVILWVVAGLVIAVATVWGALVLFYLAPGSGAVRETLAWLFAALGLVTLGALVARRGRRAAIPAFALAIAFVLVVWGNATPSNSRDWQPEVAVLPYADIRGDLVTVHNIRNFDYRTETDFTPAYYDKTFDLRRLDRVDLIAVYWMGPAIAHLFVSFGFGDDHLAISIEARKDRVREYATLPGFFRQYELVYVVADERDVIRVRTNYRKSPPEEVYLFRAIGPSENGRRVFLDYMRDINSAARAPAFLQHAHDQLHDRDPRPHGGEPRLHPVLVEGSPERVYGRVRLRPGAPGSEPALRGAEAALAYQRRGARCGQGARLLPADQGRPTLNATLNAGPLPCWPWHPLRNGCRDTILNAPRGMRHANPEPESRRVMLANEPRRKQMRLTKEKGLGLVVVPVVMAILSGAALAQSYVYPAKGQSPQQQQQDQAQCQGWAMQQSGVNPGAPPPPPSGGGQVAGTAARGAAVGAVGGAIGGNAGKGAAVGAAAGALVGGMRRADQRRAAEQSQAQASAAYSRAYAACLEGRGYTVK